MTNNTNESFTRLKLWQIDELVHEGAKLVFQSFIDKNGFVPNWARVMANDPDVLVAFVGLMKATMGPGKIEPLLKWKIANEVSDLNKCTYCVGVTESMLKALGAKEEDMKTITDLENLTDKEKVAIEYAAVVTKEAFKVPENTFHKLEDNYNQAQILEITAVVGLFNYINRFNDALRVLPEKI